MRVLVTGGAGFIGSHIVEMLLAQGHDAVVFDNFSRDALRHARLERQPEVVKGDVLDTAALKAAAKGCDAVVHLAAVAGVSAVVSAPVRVLQVNYGGTANALAAAVEANVARFVNFSTSEVYGQYAEGVSEQSPTVQGFLGEPRWSYAVSKLAAEHLCQAYHSQHGLPTVTLRPFNIYGERQVGEGGVSKMALAALQGSDVVVNGDGTQVRAWCHVSDLVQGVSLCLGKQAAVGKVFNIGNPGAAVTVLELAKRIIATAQSESKIVFKPLGYGEVFKRWPNVELAKRELGFEPKVGLDEGLARAVAWYKTQGGVA